MKKSGITILLAVIFGLTTFITPAPVIVVAAENYEQTEPAAEDEEYEIDTLCPRVITAFPSDCSYTSSSNGKTINRIELEFSEEVYLDDELSYKNITFVDQSRNKIEFKLEKEEDYYSEGKKILIKPVNSLDYDTVYVINLLDDFVQDGAGNPSKPYLIRFLTQPKPDEPYRKEEVNWGDIGQFPDVKSTHWAYEAISHMANTGVISGYPDGRFRPNESVTREQFAKMMVEALDLPVDTPKTPTFKDVHEGHWSYTYVESAKQYLAGFSNTDGSYYRGTQNAIREDIAFALVEAKGYAGQHADISQLSSIFKDTDKISAEKKQHVLIAYEKNLISGYSDKTFRPKGSITRAEAAQVLYNVLFPYSDGDDSQKQGNTIGNLINEGMVAGEDGWLYFSNRGDSFKLYKMKADGTEKIKLDDLSCKYINVVDGWIYFIADDQMSAPIYKMRIDGTEKTDVGNDNCSELSVVGNWIYYTTGEGICRMRTDGTHKTLITTDSAYNLNIVGDWIYYSNGSDNGTAYKVRVNGANNTKLNNDISVCMNVAGDSIYYVNLIDNKVYRMNTDGTGKTWLGVKAKDVNNSLNVSGDWIYYLEEPNTLYKVKVDGSGRTKMAENAFGSICIAGEWIYFRVQSYTDMHRINIDGTGRSSVLY